MVKVPTRKEIILAKMRANGMPEREILSHMLGNVAECMEDDFPELRKLFGLIMASLDCEREEEIFPAIPQVFRDDIAKEAFEKLMKDDPMSAIMLMMKVESNDDNT